MYLKGAPYHYALSKQYSHFANINEFYADYRLSIKHKYPIAVKDGLSVYNYLQNNYKELVISKDGIGLGGESAGASIVTNIVNESRKNNIYPKYQMLIYPVIETCEYDPLHDEGIMYYEYFKKFNSDVYLNELLKLCMDMIYYIKLFSQKIALIKN